jgi:hypothetical protein
MKLGRIAATLAVTVLAVAGLAVGCSDDESTSNGGTTPPVPCNEDPWQCADGQTCWIDAEGAAFSCRNSATAGVGDECVNYLGQPTCGDDLGCYQVQGQSSGVCSAYCDPEDPAHGCPASAPCRTLLFEGDLAIHLCEPPGGTGGSGTGGSGTGGSGTGGSGGATATGGAGGSGGDATGGSDTGGAGGQGGSAGAGG